MVYVQGGRGHALEEAVLAHRMLIEKPRPEGEPSRGVVEAVTLARGRAARAALVLTLMLLASGAAAHELGAPGYGT